MRVLAIVATDAEVAPLVASFSVVGHPTRNHTQFVFGRHHVDVVRTGVGMVATAAWCARILARQRCDVALNLGVCGSFTSRLPVGSVVHVVTDEMPELGAEDGAGFLPLAALGLQDPDAPPFRGGVLVNGRPPASRALAALPTARGITVNTVHGHDVSIAQVVERCDPEVESMEGAGFFYACLSAGTPCAQVRAVSNRVERRNRGAWNLAGAIGQLADVARAVIEDL